MYIFQKNDEENRDSEHTVHIIDREPGTITLIALAIGTIDENRSGIRVGIPSESIDSVVQNPLSSTIREFHALCTERRPRRSVPTGLNIP